MILVFIYIAIYYTDNNNQGIIWRILPSQLWNLFEKGENVNTLINKAIENEIV
jgi:hypothetical protein